MTERLTKDEFIAECNRRRDAGLTLEGNTYPIRDEIRDAGGIWDRQKKVWLVASDEDKERLLRLMVAQG